MQDCTDSDQDSNMEIDSSEDSEDEDLEVDQSIVADGLVRVTADEETFSSLGRKAMDALESIHACQVFVHRWSSPYVMIFGSAPQEVMFYDFSFALPDVPEIIWDQMFDFTFLVNLLVEKGVPEHCLTWGPEEDSTSTSIDDDSDIDTVTYYYPQHKVCLRSTAFAMTAIGGRSVSDQSYQCQFQRLIDHFIFQSSRISKDTNCSID